MSDSEATHAFDKPAVHLTWERRWGGAQGPGSNADPLGDLTALFRIAPMPVGSLRMEQETWEAMANHARLSFGMYGDGRRYISLVGEPEVGVIIHPVGRGGVVAMGSEKYGGLADVELARIVGAVQDAADTAPTLDERALRHAYAVYLVAFADPKISASEVERWSRPWVAATYKSPLDPVDEERMSAALKALSAETALTLPPVFEVGLLPPKADHLAAIRLGAEPHEDDAAPLSFTRFAEQLRAVLATPAA